MGDGQKQSRETHWEAPAKHQDPKERARRWEDYLEQGLHETERLIKCWLWLLGVPTLANSWDSGPFLGNPRGACWEQVGRRMRLRPRDSIHLLLSSKFEWHVMCLTCLCGPTWPNLTSYPSLLPSLHSRGTDIISSHVPPQGLCTGYSLFLECSSLR